MDVWYVLHITNPPAGQYAATNNGNPDEAIEHLKVLDAGGRHQLAASDPNSNATTCATFEAGQWGEMRRWIDRWNGQRNLYYLLNEPCTGLGAQAATRGDIAAIRGIGINFDLEPGLSFAEARKRVEDATHKIESHETCFPSFLIDSGGDRQVIWKLPKKSATKEHEHKAKCQTLGLIHKLGADSAEYETNRLCRLPGTINIPGAKKQQENPGRVAAPVRLLDTTEQLISLDELAEWIPPAERTTRERPPGPEKRQSALALARRGFRVFPIRENDKRPVRGGWQQSATTDPEKINRLWSEKPYNIGVSCGRGLVVIDYDMKPGQNGAKALAAHEALGLPTSFRVKTQSGGVHVYLKLPPGLPPLPNSVSKVAEHVDVRSDGGYVLGPGSTIDGAAYTVTDANEIEELPRWLYDKAFVQHTKVDVPKGEIFGNVDSEANIRRAEIWLAEEAPDAIANQGGNETTFKNICHIKDLGLTKDAARDVIHKWNDYGAVPPWSAAELETLLDNAYKYGTLPVGISDPSVEFEAVDLPNAAAPAWPTATQLRDRDPREIPKRRWIVPGMLARTFVSGLVAPGGTGKTQLVVNACLAIASGSEKPLGKQITERTRVWYWNQEDDGDELERRFAATKQHYGITANDISIDGAPALFVDSGADQPLVLAQRNRDRLIVPNAKIVKTLIAEIKARKIGVFIFDPLAEFHEANENDNGEMRRAMAIARRIAIEGDCAVLVVAHTRKPPQAKSDGFAGDFDTFRGAGSQGNVIRLGLTLYGMSAKDADTFGVPKKDKGRYIRLDLGKANLCPRDGVPLWFKWFSVPVGDFEDGEQIGVLSPVDLKEHGADSAVLETLAKTIASGAGGLDRKQPYPLAQVIKHLEPHEKKIFKDKRHQTEAINRALNAPGIGPGAEGAETLTQYGKLTVVTKRGRGGTQITLGPAPAQQSEWQQ